MSNVRVSPSKCKVNDADNKQMLAVNMGLDGKGITTMSNITIEREIESWEERLYTMEDNLLDLEET